MNLTILIAANNARWAKMQILPARELEVEKVAARLSAPKAKAIYQQISQAVWNTPDRWWFVAIVHEREASQNFACSIAQGDPWNQVSRNVPRGLGPFKSFIDAAIYTLTRVPVGGYIPAKWTDWSIGGVLTLFELYNGLGYEMYHSEASPYDWGATTIEQEGKYIADARFSPMTWDTQVGCAAMIKAMMAIDPLIVFGSPANANTAVPGAAVPPGEAKIAPAPIAKPAASAGPNDGLLVALRDLLRQVEKRLAA